VLAWTVRVAAALCRTPCTYTECILSVIHIRYTFSIRNRRLHCSPCWSTLGVRIRRSALAPHFCLEYQLRSSCCWCHINKNTFVHTINIYVTINKCHQHIWIYKFGVLKNVIVIKTLLLFMWVDNRHGIFCVLAPCIPPAEHILILFVPDKRGCWTFVEQIRLWPPPIISPCADRNFHLATDFQPLGENAPMGGNCWWRFLKCVCARGAADALRWPVWRFLSFCEHFSHLRCNFVSIDFCYICN